MALVPLKIPAGMLRNGTDYEASGRWLLRFKRQPQSRDYSFDRQHRFIWHNCKPTAVLCALLYHKNVIGANQ